MDEKVDVRVQVEPLVSIVVPVYNVQAYVEQCLDSILAQTYQNMELILVLNGSTDGSDVICQKYAAKDGRIKLLKIDTNEGVTKAWKYGVQEASGEYLGFVDADDYIEPDMYQRLMECRENFDLVITRWIREDGPKSRIGHDPLMLGAYKSEAEMTFLYEHLISTFSLESKCHIYPGLSGFLWNKLFKTALAQDVFRQISSEIRVYSDLIGTSLYVLKCRSVLLTDICCYHYRIRQTSVSHLHSPGENMNNLSLYYNTLYPVFDTHPSRSMLLKQLELKVSTVLMTKSGFSLEAQNKKLVFPFLNLLDNKKIVLCGAGIVGQSYYRQIQSHQVAQLTLWVDSEWEYRQWEGWPVHPVEELFDVNCDCVVIAAFHKEAAMRMKEVLTNLGLPEEKILWKTPLVL